MWSPFANGWCEVWFERRLHFNSINYAILGVWTIGLSFFFIGKFWEKSREAPQLTPSLTNPPSRSFKACLKLRNDEAKKGLVESFWVNSLSSRELPPPFFWGGGVVYGVWVGVCWTAWTSIFFFSTKSRPLVFRTIATWANFITTSQTKPAGWSPPKMAIMSLIHSSLGISSEFAPKMDGFIFLSCFSVTDFWFRHPIIWGPFQLNPRSPGEKKPWPTPPSWARNSITSWNAPGSRWGKLSWAGGGRTSKGRGFLMLMFFFLNFIFFIFFCKQRIFDSQNPWKMVLRCFQTVFFGAKIAKTVSFFVFCSHNSGEWFIMMIHWTFMDFMGSRP